MTINDKIFAFIRDNKIDDVDFYKSIQISKQQWYQISNGKSNFTVEMLKKIKRKYPFLDLNKLLDDKEESFMMVMEPRAEYDSSLQKDLKKAISLLEKYTK